MKHLLIGLLAFGISLPMWARYLESDDYATGKETNAEDFDPTADDKMPEPTSDAPEKTPVEKSPVAVAPPAPTPAPAPPAALATPAPLIPPAAVLSPLPMLTVTPTPQAVLGGVWQPPDYSHQERALGYVEAAFGVPHGLEDRVHFWMDIYTRYTNDQGLLHDSKYLHLIYETVDLSDITNNPVMTAREKDRAKEKRIKGAKKLVAERLKSLASVKDPSALQGDDLRYWKLFEPIDEKNKFTEAARRGRLRYQAGQRDQFSRGIMQSGRYLRQMEAIFKEEGLPIELTRLPFVESSFNLGARSKVGASGIWQFMRTTGRLYLRMDDVCDERNDPLKATRAAARKFKQDFLMLQSWPLTITGWNHGSAGVRRLVERYKTRDIAELTDVRRGRFKFASANFFASFLAALEVERNAAANFGVLQTLPEVKGEELKLEKELTIGQLVKWFGDDEEKAKMYNPHIRSTSWSKGSKLHKKDFVRLPTELMAKAKLDLDGAAAAN